MIVKRNPPKRKKGKSIQKIILDNKIRFPFPYILENEIKQKFTMLNPEYVAICNRRRLKTKDRPKGAIITKENKGGRWTSRSIPQWLFYWDYDGSDLVVPRGAFQLVKNLFKRHGKKYKLINKRVFLDTTDFQFYGDLLKSKGQLIFPKYKAKNGVLQAGTGTGKTVMALYYAAKIRQRTIVVVDTNELLEQWKNRIQTFYKLNKNKIGHIGGGQQTIKPITVALVQTLRNNPELLKHFGMLIIDECHISTTQSYGKVINNFYGQYTMGLSATPRRRDGFTRVMFWLLGKIALKIDRDDVEKLPAIGVFHNTKYEGELSFKKAYSLARAAMLRDEERNQLIVNNIIKKIDIFGIHLIISSSSLHLERLLDMMPHHFQLISKLLVGKINTEERKKIVQQAVKNKIKFLFATDKLIGKGFDEELLSVLHITAPIADPDKIEQACGRVTRVPKLDEIKELKTKAWIIYYFDSKENTLRSAASTAAKKFNQLGIEKRIQKAT